MRRLFAVFLLCFAPFCEAQKPILVGYLPQWALYNTPAWSAKALITSGSAQLLDQVNYAQAFAVNGKCVVADPHADIDQLYTAQTSVDGGADKPDAPLKGEFHQVQELKGLYPKLRVLISLEGKASSFAEAALPQNRVAFVASCIDVFLRGHLRAGLDAPGLFDGFDLDWEFPQSPDEGANYTALLTEFRKQMDSYAAANRTAKPLLTVAIGPGIGRYPGMDWKQVASVVDEVGLMNYDFSGPWQKQTGLIAPLYPVPGHEHEGGNVDATVTEYEGAGIPAAKLLVGVPFYGYHWQGVSETGPTHGVGEPGEAVHEDVPYWQLARDLKPDKIFRDERSQTAWFYDGDAFWTFDDPQSAQAKASYAAAHGLGGMMVWELSGDTAGGSLMRALDQGLHGTAHIVAAKN